MTQQYKGPVETKTGYSTPSWIVSDNQIKTRKYNLVIDGNVVEEFLSSKMANIFRDEYRSEGFAVDKVEVFSVTKGINIVGDNMVLDDQDMTDRKIRPTSGMPTVGLNTPAASMKKVEQDRAKMRAKNAGKVNRSVNGRTLRYTSVGRERNSTLHSLYIENLRKNGFRVHNKITDQVWIGVQKEIAERIVQYVKFGGKITDLDIKFLGAK